jgi:hypothetical protein
VQAVVTLAEVRAVETRRGSVRHVARDTDGNEYTTFREDIGQRAGQLQGQRVRINYHEEQRGQYTNVYLDKIDKAGPEGGDGDAGKTEPQEAAWQTAVAAAPWLVGEPGSAVPPEKLYDKLKPFEERVEADIEQGQQERREGQEGT